MPTIYRNSLAYSQTVAYGGFTPVGTVISVMGNSAPTNYLKCDGTVYNISAYPDLAAYFTAEFGQANKFGGDGTTTFAVPDLRGEFLRGTGTNSHTDQGSGANVGTHQDGTVDFNWFYNPDGNYFGLQRVPGTYSEQGGNADHYLLTSNATTLGRQVTLNSSWTSASTANAHTSRPTNTSVLYCIAYKNIYIENGGGSGSSGHTIQDTDGNDMPAEDNLQFIGLLVQDDSTNGVTTVEAEGLNSDSLDDILDGSIGNEIINNGMSYSTEEQVVGKWIDGKPIYQKTYSFSNVAINANTEFVMASYDSSIDKIICGFLNTPYKDAINPVYITNDSTKGIVSYVALPSKTTGSLWSHCNSFTIQYTKTTD